ncbi:MAG: LysE family translocator [Proteobacteria bacterium]|nr:LysE family translocator [Pseudomonadota bacterium]
MIHFLTIGTVLGLSAGFAPGPLLTLVISETLQHDIKSGVKVALAPIITDLPIIILTLFILSKLSNFHNILGTISLAGGLFILSMGYKSMRTKGVEINLQEMRPKSLTKGVLANALSPHPYLFWFSVGAPTMTKAMLLNVSAPLAFIISFYTFLVGSKIVLAILIGKSKSLLSGNAYIFTMRFLGLVLCGLAVVLFHDGLKLLAII